MPSSQVACTAMITKVKNTNQPIWTYNAYTEKNNGELELIGKSCEILTYERMRNINKKSQRWKIAQVEIMGNIPFISSGKTELVLVDTPGADSLFSSYNRDALRKY